MDPIDIQYELRKKKILQQEIAKEAGVSAMSISKVIRGGLNSVRLMDLISQKLGKDPREVFDRYPAEIVYEPRARRQGNQ